MTKKYWTLAIQYDVDGEPCDPPHHIEERLFALMQTMHEVGVGMNLVYGRAEASVLEAIENDASE